MLSLPSLRLDHRSQARWARLNSYGRRRTAETLKPTYPQNTRAQRQKAQTRKALSWENCTQTHFHTQVGLYLTVCRLLRIMFSRCLRLAVGTFPSLVDFELEAVPMLVLLE